MTITNKGAVIDTAAATANITLPLVWVLLDLIDIYAQLGVDVFARMRQLS